MARAPAGRFCWVDLAATDATRAIDFYGSLFGWDAAPQAANGGVLVRLTQRGRDVGSLYQLARPALDQGVRSHWTPYVRVEDATAASDRARALGGSVAVEPFAVEGMARIALLVDPDGAAFGIWEGLPG
jgi:predicted enzyme related to lactoylglutathione lyase